MPPDYYLDQIDWLTAFQRGLTIAADVTDADTIFVAAEQVIERWGELDVWVNNAMVTMFAPVSDMSPAEFRRIHGGYLSGLRLRNHGGA